MCERVCRVRHLHPRIDDVNEGQGCCYPGCSRATPGPTTGCMGRAAHADLYCARAISAPPEDAAPWGWSLSRTCPLLTDHRRRLFLRRHRVILVLCSCADACCCCTGCPERRRGLEREQTLIGMRRTSGRSVVVACKLGEFSHLAGEMIIMLGDRYAPQRERRAERRRRRTGVRAGGSW